MSEKTISAEQVAILAERVDQQNLNWQKMEGLLTGIAMQQAQAAQNAAVMAERMARLEENKGRLFNLADAQRERTEKLEKEVHVHAWIWKVVGSVAVIALSVVSYGFNSLQTLKEDGNGRDKRIAILEFITGGRAQQMQPPRTHQEQK